MAAETTTEQIRELQVIIKQIQCACHEAQVQAQTISPFLIKNTPSTSSLEASVATLQAECKQKERLISAMLKEVRLRTDSKVYNDMLDSLTHAGYSTASFESTDTWSCASNEPSLNESAILQYQTYLCPQPQKWALAPVDPDQKCKENCLPTDPSSQTCSRAGTIQVPTSPEASLNDPSGPTGTSVLIRTKIRSVPNGDATKQSKCSTCTCATAEKGQTVGVPAGCKPTCLPNDPTAGTCAHPMFPNCPCGLVEEPGQPNESPTAKPEPINSSKLCTPIPAPEEGCVRPNFPSCPCGVVEPGQPSESPAAKPEESPVPNTQPENCSKLCTRMPATSAEAKGAGRLSGASVYHDCLETTEAKQEAANCRCAIMDNPDCLCTSPDYPFCSCEDHPRVPSDSDQETPFLDISDIIQKAPFLFPIPSTYQPPNGFPYLKKAQPMVNPELNKVPPVGPGENLETLCNCPQKPTRKSGIPLRQKSQDEVLTMYMCPVEPQRRYGSKKRRSIKSQRVVGQLEAVSSIFEITEVRKVGDDGLILKWSKARRDVSGFEIEANGVLKSRITNGLRTTAVVHSLELKNAIRIDVYALKEEERLDPPAKAVFLP